MKSEEYVYAGAIINTAIEGFEEAEENPLGRGEAYKLAEGVVAVVEKIEDEVGGVRVETAKTHIYAEKKAITKLTVRVPAGLIKMAKKKAIDEGTTLSRILTLLLADYVAGRVDLEPA